MTTTIDGVVIEHADWLVVQDEGTRIFVAGTSPKDGQRRGMVVSRVAKPWGGSDPFLDRVRAAVMLLEHKGAK